MIKIGNRDLLLNQTIITSQTDEIVFDFPVDTETQMKVRVEILTSATTNGTRRLITGPDPESAERGLISIENWNVPQISTAEPIEMAKHEDSKIWIEITSRYSGHMYTMTFQFTKGQVA